MLTKDQMDACISHMIGGTKTEVKQKTWAYSQIKTLEKYQNMNTKHLAKKVNLPEKLVKRFRKWYKEVR